MKNRTLSRYGVMGVFSAFRGALGSGEDGGTPDPTQPSYNPYELNYTPGSELLGPEYGPEYRPELLGPEYGPEYRPELLAKPLPTWVVPAAVGAGAFVLLGGLGLILGTKRKRRR